MNVEILKKQINLVKSSGNRCMYLYAENVAVSMYHAEEFIYDPNGSKHNGKTPFTSANIVGSNDTLILSGNFCYGNESVYISTSKITSIKVIEYEN